MSLGPAREQVDVTQCPNLWAEAQREMHSRRLPALVSNGPGLGLLGLWKLGHMSGLGDLPSLVQGQRGTGPSTLSFIGLLRYLVSRMESRFRRFHPITRRHLHCYVLHMLSASPELFWCLLSGVSSRPLTSIFEQRKQYSPLASGRKPVKFLTTETAASPYCS